MSILLLVLAVLGFVAVARRAALALLGLLGRGVDRFLAGEVAEVRARRGDLTGLTDARNEEKSARRAQVAAVAIFSFWTILLVVPTLTPWPRPIYATYSVLWLLPRAVARTS
jgi:hypothetical protein